MSSLTERLFNQPMSHMIEPHYKILKYNNSNYNSDNKI